MPAPTPYETDLAWLDSRGLRRDLRTVTPVSAVEVILDGKRLVHFSTNDYFGLSGHPRVRLAAADAATRFGMGPRSSALVCGHTGAHDRLVEEIAHLKQTETAVLFPTGYQANLGLLCAIGGPDVEIFSDELNHASIVDGCRLSRSLVRIYRHADIGHLDSLLRASRSARKLIITEALFSMEGDLAPLAEIVRLKEREGALLALDEAHSTLVLGPCGGGLADALGLSSAVDLQMGTLSKAIGALGGYVACTASMRDVLINRARTFIFTTALPIPVVAAASAALETFRDEPGLREGLRHNCAVTAEALARMVWTDGCLAASTGPIFPIVLGESSRAVSVSHRLVEEGYFIAPIRPPTVPAGTSRLRPSVSAVHSPVQVESMVGALSRALR